MVDLENKVRKGIKFFKEGHCSIMVKGLPVILEIISSNSIRNDFFSNFLDGHLHPLSLT